jgi:hypothetical protein
MAGLEDRLTLDDETTVVVAALVQRGVRGFHDDCKPLSAAVQDVARKFVARGEAINGRSANGSADRVCGGAAEAGFGSVTFMTTNEIAEAAGCSTRHVRDECAEGSLHPYAQKTRRGWRVEGEAAEVWIASR